MLLFKCLIAFWRIRCDNILILFMVEQNIDNNIIMKSFILQLVSTGLDDTDFAQLEIATSG